jgi:nicotinamide riboside kinase
MDLQSTGETILLAVEVHWSDDSLACIDGNTKRRGFSLDTKGFFIEQCFMTTE